MTDTTNHVTNVENQIIWVEPTSGEGFRLRAVEVAADLARQRTNSTGIQFTTDDIIHSARKIYSFIDKGF